MRRGLVATAVVISVALGGCKTANEDIGMVVGAVAGGVIGSQFGSGAGQVAATIGGAAAGGLLGRWVGSMLNEEDQVEVQQTSASALETAQDGQTVEWTNSETGSNAQITPRETRTVTTETRIIREKEVVPPPQLTLIGEDYVALKSANMRRGPTTESAVAASLATGDRIHTVGKVTDADWYLVARNGRSIGYVYGPLLAPLPAAESNVAQDTTIPAKPLLRSSDQVAVAAEPGSAEAEAKVVNLDEMLGDDVVAEQVAVVTTCRDVDISVSNGDSSESGSYSACKAADGAWEIN
jgi:surface antigen